MGIEGLEKIHKNYIKTIFNKKSKVQIVTTNSSHLILFMQEVIDTFKDQSDEIANLRQELAKKEDVIEVNDIKVGGTD